MKRREFTLGAAALATFGASLAPIGAAWAATGYTSLKQRAPVDAPDGKIEVIQFFSYGCVHCMHFEPIFEKWSKTLPDDVVVRRVHVGFNSSFEPLQRIFATLDAMGQVDAMQEKVFQAIQNDRLPLNKTDTLFAWVAKQGLNQAEFEKIYKSFGVATQVRKATQLQEDYQVEGTPALGIAGRYYTDGSMAKGFEGMIKVANELIDKERATA